MLKSPTVELFSHSRRVLTRLIRAMCEISGNIAYLAKAHRGAGLPASPPSRSDGKYAICPGISHIWRDLGMVYGAVCRVQKFVISTP